MGDGRAAVSIKAAPAGFADAATDVEAAGVVQPAVARAEYPPGPARTARRIVPPRC